MPIYEYRCSSCGVKKEHLQKISDPKLTVCPECGKSTYEKQLTAAGFQLKGSGWYVTDFKGGSATTSVPSKKDDGSGKDAAAKDAGSTDSGSKESGAKDSGSGSSASTAAPAASTSTTPASGT